MHGAHDRSDTPADAGSMPNIATATGVGRCRAYTTGVAVPAARYYRHSRRENHRRQLVKKRMKDQGCFNATRCFNHTSMNG